MTRTYEAYTPISQRPVRTFNAKDLAEKYRDDMAALGTEIVLKVVRMDRRRIAA